LIVVVGNLGVDRTLRDGSIWFCGLSIRQRWQVWV